MNDLSEDDGARKTARLPWFPCEPAKLLGAIAGMKPDQKLTYMIVLLRIYEVGGACTDPLDALATRSGINRRRVSEALDVLFRLGKLVRRGDGIHNPYAEQVLAESVARHNVLARAGQAGGIRSAKKREKNQQNGTTQAQASLNPGSTHLHLQKKEDSLFPSGNRAAEPPPEGEVDARTALFRAGREALERITGKPNDACRRLIGKWLKTANDDAVMVHRTIEDAERNRAADPVSWIARRLEPRPGSAFDPRRSKNGMAALALRMMEINNEENDDGRDADTENGGGALPAGSHR